MTDHEKLMLHRHLLSAARTYEARAQELRAFPAGCSVPCDAVAAGYQSLATDARRTAARLKNGIDVSWSEPEGETR